MLEMSVKQNLLAWSKYLNSVRRFFEQRHFLEVQTPTLVTSPGSEPFLDFFETEQKWGQEVSKRYLPASPELSLKKLLSYDVGSVFEIRSCFRNQEGSNYHRTEFFMLEWYAVGLDLNGLVAQSFEFLLETGIKTILPNVQLQCYSVKGLFEEVLDFDLKPDTDARALYGLSQRYNLVTGEDWGFDDLFHLIMLEKIEPFLKLKGLVYVKEYPPSQAALSRLNSGGWAERFEIYLHGVELANAYFELTDSKEQTRRHHLDNTQRVTLGRPEMPLDSELVRALEGSFPKRVSGIAFGLERYFMLLNQRESIHFWSPLWSDSTL